MSNSSEPEQLQQSDQRDNNTSTKRQRILAARRLGSAIPSFLSSAGQTIHNMASALGKRAAQPTFAGIAARGNRNGAKKNAASKTKVDKGEHQLLQMTEEAEYEIHIDPYRGIQTLQQEQQSSNSTTDSSSNNNKNNNNNVAGELTVQDLTAETSHLTLNDKIGPWRRKCTMGDVATSKSINTDDRASGTTSRRATTLTTSVLEDLTGDSDQENDHNDNNDDIQEVLDPDRAAALRLVRSICECDCPSLVQWTEDGIKQRNKKGSNSKKRKMTAVEPPPITTGRRPADRDRRCPCDYNPFCLATLGGGMDDILQEHARLLQQQDDEDEDDDDDDDDDDVVMLGDSPTGNGSSSSTTTAADTTTDSTITTTTPTPNWDDPKSRYYSPETRAKLAKVRRSQLVREESVRSYLKSILQGLTSAMSLDKGIEQVRKMHAKLIFVNPLVDDENDNKNSKDRQLRLSMPPGIENLGATCYLNTQLQCLAQNRVFLEGIVSWRAPPTNGGGSGAEDRMNSVLSLFQDLLVRMNAGSCSTINTLDFSNSLGLDHYEQQDPNEFSRLFLDKIHESFQQSAAGGRNDLSNLLPHIFQGVMKYETICSECKNISSRVETFMDLNLPIVHLSEEREKDRKTGQQTISKFFGGSDPKRDTDLQFCLDQYCHPESLDGDNQYFCSQCDRKVDAKRTLTFQKVPPVLNVQLSRYVFDRKTFMKKKLSDKVLLPLDLSVEARSEERRKGIVKHRYVLCAVMRHKGTSAFSGHYVGEAMDWLTGQWFEFNDEKVVWLVDGPSNSIDLSAIGTAATADASSTNSAATATTGAKKRKTATVVPPGSQDAYNMYYVEESFLAQSALDGLRKQGSPKHADNELCVVDKVAMDRSEFYGELSQMCMEDGNAATRLKRRKERIRTEIFPNLLNSQSTTKPDDLVWVDTSQLLQYISCEDRMQERLDEWNDRTLLQHHELLCSHEPQGLHPRVARKGKLLPRAAYEAYVAGLREEQRAVLGHDGEEDTVCDCVILPSDNLVCVECSREYQEELGKKLKKVKAIKKLYDMLDTKELNRFKLEIGNGDTYGRDRDKFAYIASRQFITGFRNLVMVLMKNAVDAAADAKACECESSLVSFSAENVNEGLDGLELSAFEAKAFGSGPQADNSVAIPNSNITCQHKNFVAASRNSYRYVSWSTWKAIANLFPRAIELRKKRPGMTFDDDVDVDEDEDEDDDDDDDLFGCNICHIDKAASNSLVTHLTNLADAVRKKAGVDGLSDADLVKSAAESPTLRFHILHRDDMAAWKSFLDTFTKRNEKKRLSEEPDETAKSVLLPKHSPPSRDIAKDAATEFDGSNLERAELLEKVFRPIVCARHRRPIHSALFQPQEDQCKVPLSLSDQVCIVDENEYKDFVAHVAAAALMLVRDPSEENYTTHQFVSGAAKFCEQLKLDRHCHPQFSSYCPGTGSDTERFCVSTADFKMGMGMLFKLETETCKDEECCKLFKDWQNTELALKNAAKVSSAPTAAASKQKAKNTGVSSDPIAIDSDIEEVESPSKFSLRVFDVEPGASQDEILSALAGCSGLPAKTESEATRRSTRKRKARFPVGVIRGEEVVPADLRHNAAALRLLIFEQCGKTNAFELDHSLKLVVFARPDSEEPIVLDLENDAEKEPGLPKIVDLSFDLCAETLEDLCESAAGKKVGSSFSPADSIMILRQPDVDVSAGDLPKDALMDHFIATSNATSDDKNGGSGGETKKRTRAERGFTGTFLSSGPSSNAGASSETDSACNKDNGITKPENCDSSEPKASSTDAKSDSPPIVYSRSVSQHDRRKDDDDDDDDNHSESGKASKIQRTLDITDETVDGVTAVKSKTASASSNKVRQQSTSTVKKPMKPSNGGDQTKPSTHAESTSRSKNKSGGGESTNGKRKIARPSRNIAPKVKGTKVEDGWFREKSSEDEDDDDDEVPTYVNPKAEQQSGGASSERNLVSTTSTKRQRLVDSVANRLAQFTPPDKREFCDFAAESAVHSNPTCNQADQLVDPAFSKYQELTGADQS